MKKILILVMALCLMLCACRLEPAVPQPTPTPTVTPSPTPERPLELNDKNIAQILRDQEFCDPDTGEIYRLDRRGNFYPNGFDGRFSFCYVYSENQPELGHWLAIRQLGENATYFLWQTDIVDREFYSHNRGYECDWENILKLYCNETKYEAVIDFDKKTIDFRQCKTPPLYYYDKIAENGDNTLYSCVTDSGGDAVYYDIVLYNNATGEEKILTEGGGMYGGGTSTGFFSNGDIYILNYDRFETFDSNGNKLVTLGDRYPFGDLNEGNLQHRILRAVRRDPVDKTYLALYFEEEKWDNYSDRFLDASKNDLELKATYKIGHFDSAGNLLKEYDTTAHAVMAMGIAPVDMWLEGTDTIRFFTWHKSRDNVYNKGKLNLTTGEFTLEYNAFDNWHT